MSDLFSPDDLDQEMLAEEKKAEKEKIDVKIE